MEMRLRSPSQKTDLWCSNRGSILLEALVAIGLAGIIFSAGVGLLLTTRMVGSRALMRQEALWAVQEGISALQTMAFEDLSTTESGGLTFTAEHWQMDGSPDLLPGGFLRTVRARDVQRDGDCFIVSSGGAVDEDTREIESEVSWTDVAGRTQNVIVTGLTTRWNNPQGSCFEPTMANCFKADISEAEWYGGKQLREIDITNSCSTDVIVSNITINWNNSQFVQQVFFGNSKVWSASGPGTPSGNQTSGTLLNIEDEILSSLETVEMHKTQFTGTMSGVTVDVTFMFTDGSTVVTGPFVPSH